MRKSFKGFMTAALIAAGCFLAAPQPAQAAADFTVVSPAKSENEDGCEAAIIADEAAAQGSTISITKEQNKKNVYQSAFFRFTMPEDGIAHIRYSMNEGSEGGGLNAVFTLYSDKNMTNICLAGVAINGTKSEEKAVALPKGTYYIEVTAIDDTWMEDYSAENRVGVAVAYIPVKGNTTDFEVTYSTTKTTTSPVTVTIATADPDAGIWYRAAVVESHLVDNDSHWNDDLFCKEKSFTVKKNGTYTIRIKDSLGNCKQEVIKITNIDKTKPMTPQAATYKKGTTVVSGTAEAGTKVYVKLGSKTYSTTALDDGTFSVKTAKLAAGDSFTVYAKDAAGNQSQSKKYTVKK